MAFSLGMDDGTLRYQGWLCVPNVDGLRERIMTEARISRFPHEGYNAVWKEREIESKVVRDPSSIVPVETIAVNEELAYEETLVAILDRQVDWPSYKGNSAEIFENLETLEVQKASEVNDSQEPYLEVEAENPSLALDQNQEELSNAQNERMMLMLEAILQNEEKQSLALEDLKQALHQNNETIHTLEDQMKSLIEAHYAYQFESVERGQEASNSEEESELYFEESIIEHPPTDSMSVSDAKKNMKLESTKKFEEMVEMDSSSGDQEDVKIRKELHFGGLRSHSKHFSTLELCGDKGIELHESIRECDEERQRPYILQFEGTMKQNDIPHMKTKKYKMKKLMLGLNIYLPPPIARGHKLDSKLGAQFISSKWQKKW
ncbi:WEB family protein At3g02930, chloroplastic-like [Nicotiana tomentosiformis]|uniref:WEB family protein At3g02930, chloroplastic-like n=1 Tax=Nicotiana tomentosiformis TaxID=4098 RepID=UPI00388C356C